MGDADKESIKSYDRYIVMSKSTLVIVKKLPRAAFSCSCHVEYKLDE